MDSAASTEQFSRPLGDSLVSFVTASPLRRCLCALFLLGLSFLIKILATRVRVCESNKVLKAVRGCVRYLLRRILPTRQQPRDRGLPLSPFASVPGLDAS